LSGRLAEGTSLATVLVEVRMDRRSFGLEMIAFLVNRQTFCPDPFPRTTSEWSG
jgi:hypothetical protein